MAAPNRYQAVLDSWLGPHFVLLRESRTGDCRVEPRADGADVLKWVRSRMRTYKLGDVIENIGDCVQWTRSPREEHILGVFDDEAEAQVAATLASVDRS